MRRHGSAERLFTLVAIALVAIARARASPTTNGRWIDPVVDESTLGHELCRSLDDGERACARVKPRMISSDGVALFREHKYASEVNNFGDVDLVVYGVSVDGDSWFVMDFVEGETVPSGKTRTYDLRFSPNRVGDLWNTLMYNTSVGLVTQLLPSVVYRNPYELTALVETVPFDVPVEFDMKLFNPTPHRLAVNSAFATAPEVEIEPATFSVAEPSVTRDRGRVSEDSDTIRTVARWALTSGERAAILRLRILIRKEEFMTVANERKSIDGYLVLNVTTETSLMRIPFSFTPQRDLIYMVEKHIEFDDVTSARERSTKYLRVFNALKTAIEIKSVFVEDPDRDLSIKFGKGTIVPPLTTVSVARLTRIGHREGYIMGVVRVHTNVSSVVLRVPYSARVLHGALTVDADKLLFQAPIGPYGEKVPEGEHMVRRTFEITNTFSQDVILSSWRVPQSMDRAFPISGISDVRGSVIKAGGSIAVTLDFQPRYYGAAMSTTLRILHNNTRTGTRVPIVIYSGELTVQSNVDFGVMGVGLRRKVHVKFINHNPIPVEVHTMKITGTRSITGTTFSLRADSKSEVYAEDVFDIDSCIELSGNVCTQVVKGRLEPDGVLEIRLTAAPLAGENLGDGGAELSLATSLGVVTTTQLNLVATNGKVFSEDQDIQIELPITELYGKKGGTIRREVTVHSTHEVPVSVSGFLETESEILEFESALEISVPAGKSASIGEILFSTNRQANELASFANSDADELEASLSKFDVNRLEKLQRSMNRLAEDGALMALGRLVFSSEAQNGHQAVNIQAQLTYPRFLEIQSKKMDHVANSEHITVISKDTANTISVTNLSKMRTLCFRVLPLLAHSVRTTRWSEQKVVKRDETLLQTNIKAARAYASVDEENLRETPIHPGFVSKYLVDRKGACLRPEEKQDILTIVFDPRLRMRTYTASVCIKNTETFIECVELMGYSGTSVVETGTRTGTQIYVRVAVAIGCVAVVYLTASRRDSWLESPSASPHGFDHNTSFSNPKTHASPSKKAQKSNVKVVSPPSSQDSSDSELGAPPEVRMLSAESPARQSDDSALMEHRHVETVVKLDRTLKKVEQLDVDTDKREAVRRGGRPERMSEHEKEVQLQKARQAKDEEREANTKPEHPPGPALDAGAVVLAPTEPSRVQMKPPRSVMHRHTLSTVSSEKSHEVNEDQYRTPEALFDMYNNMFAEVLSAHPPSRQTASMFRAQASAPEYVSPPNSVRSFATPPGSVADYDMFTAPALAGTTGLHMGNLFSFRGGEAAPADTSLRSQQSTSPSMLSPADSMGRSGWRTMLSEWEERQDREVDQSRHNRSQNHSNDSFSQ